MRSARGNKGFTVLELILVIVVIAVLAVISIVSYTGVQSRGRAAAISDGLIKVKNAFHLLNFDQQQLAWPDETSFDGNSNPRLKDVIRLTNLKGYLSQEPTEENNWIYDNDNLDTRDSTSCLLLKQGVNIIVTKTTLDVVTLVDKALDDGDPNCGNVRWSTPDQLYYGLSGDQNTETPQ